MATQLTFRAKLIALVGLAALSLLLLVGASAWIARRVDRQLDTIQKRYVPKVDLEPRLEGQFDRLRRAFQDAVAIRDDDALAATQEQRTQFLAQLDAAHDAVDASDGAALRHSFEDYYATAYDVSRRMISGETGEDLVDAIAAMQTKQATATSAIKKAAALDRNELARAFGEVARLESTSRAYELWIAIGCLVPVAALTLGLSRSLLQSVSALTEGFARFGKGEFGRPIDAGSRDELGDVARSANRMASSLERLTGEQRRAEERFRALLESAPDAMVIVDDGGRIALVNAQAERLFGLSRAEMIGEPATKLLPEPMRRSEIFSAPKDAAVRAPIESVGLKRDGTEFPFELSRAPIETDEGTLVSCAIRDVTERKRTEAALQLSNRELEAFSYSVAHDLRAPLRGIHGFAQVLMEDHADVLGDEAKKHLDRITAAAERMGKLIDALLDLARLSRVEIRREPLDLSKLAAATAQQLRAAQPDRSVAFEIQPDVTTQGDATLLRALFENLFGNAWKFTAKTDSARIVFETTRDKGSLVYHVRDNGAGFDMAYADKLFAPFRRLHRAEEFPGTGIGLATVHRIVQRHGGRIWAEGEMGKGASFHFTLWESREGES